MSAVALVCAVMFVVVCACAAVLVYFVIFGAG